MRPIQKITSLAATAILVAGGLAFAGTTPAQAKPTGFKQMNSCGTSAARGFARCMAVVRTTVTSLSSDSVTALAATPSGLSPASLQSAYNLPSSTAGSGKTIAIVDAYDDPNAEADLGVYRGYFGLSACTTAN